MKKTIIIFGLALVAFTNVSNASNIKLLKHKEAVVFYVNSPLCSAIVKGDLNAVKVLIEYGSNVNELSNDFTPLMLAARYNRTDIVAILLKNGADISVKNEKGFTAIKYAELSNATESLNLLKKS
jgi:uncharacterized protein